MPGTSVPTPAPDGPQAATRGSYPPPVERLIAELSRLPGVGRRSAERMAFHLLRASREEAGRLARAIEEVKSVVRHCGVCFNLTQSDPCSLCTDAGRDRSTVLVVEQPRDLIALEQTGMYRGIYHVLLGRLSPLEGIGPSHLTIDRLRSRVEDPSLNAGGVRVREVILGLNPTLEGDGTSLFLTEQLRPTGVRVTRLARGLPTGAPLEHASKAVLADALHGRQAVE